MYRLIILWVSQFKIAFESFKLNQEGIEWIGLTVVDGRDVCLYS